MRKTPSLRRLWRQPHPLELDPKKDFIKSLLTGMFVSVFLLVFQPFDLSGNEAGLRYLLIGGYGLVSFLGLAANLTLAPKLLRKVFREDDWTVGREILWFLWIIFFIGLASFLFACLVNAARPFFKPGFPPLPYLLLFQFMALVVALFPVVFWTLWNQSRNLKRNLQAAREISDTVRRRDMPVSGAPTARRPVVLIAENGKDRYAFDAGAILFLAAGGNYVELAERGGRAGAVLIRSSLGRIQEQLDGYAHLFRCHRAFIVNLLAVKKATGNAQGLKLELEGTDKKIPVARRCVRAFKQRLTAV